MLESRVFGSRLPKTRKCKIKADDYGDEKKIRTMTMMKMMTMMMTTMAMMFVSNCIKTDDNDDYDGPLPPRPQATTTSIVRLTFPPMIELFLPGQEEPSKKLGILHNPSAPQRQSPTKPICQTQPTRCLRIWVLALFREL